MKVKMVREPGLCGVPATRPDWPVTGSVNFPDGVRPQGQSKDPSMSSRVTCYDCVKQSRTRMRPIATSVASSRMAGSMNPADTRTSTWEDEMSHRIDSLPSRRRSRVRLILMPAGERARLSSAARATSAASASAARCARSSYAVRTRTPSTHLGYSIGT
jgi:hypothetical protein